MRMKSREVRIAEYERFDRCHFLDLDACR